MPICPTKSAALAMKDRRRIHKGGAGKIIGWCAVQIDHPGARIFPARVVFFHPQNLFARVQDVVPAGNDAVEGDTLPRLAVKGLRGVAEEMGAMRFCLAEYRGSAPVRF